MEQQDRSATVAKDGGGDEISLLDVLLVLLRRRRIVLRTTLAAAVLGALFFYVAPAVGLRKVESYVVETNLIPTLVPYPIRSDVGIDVPNYAASLARDLSFVADIAWESGLGSDLEASGPRDPLFLSWLKESFLGKAYSATIANGIITLSLEERETEKAERFMRSVSARLDAELRRIVAERAARLFESTSALVEKSWDDNGGVSDYLKTVLVSSQAYSVGNITLISEMNAMTMRSVRKGNRNGFAVVILGGFLLGILAAFCVDAVAAIRRDERSVGRIRDALAFGVKRRG